MTDAAGYIIIEGKGAKGRESGGTTMKAAEEKGMLSQSEVYFLTPSATARKLFYYMTCCGHFFSDSMQTEGGAYISIPGRSGDQFLLAYIRRGAIDVENGEVRYTAVKGQAAVIDCGLSFRISPAQGTEAVWIHAGGANIRDFYEQIVSFHGGKQFFCPSAGSRVYTDMLKLVEEQGKGSRISESQASRKLYELLCCMLFNGNLDDGMRSGEPVSDAVAYIDVHYHEELSVEDIAMAVNLSAAYFSRHFRSCTGFSPHEYIILKRLCEAKKLLHESDKTVREIAYEVGYHSEVNFITSFKEKVGMPPAVFRRSVL